jgi:hypothetical protein
MKFWVRIAKRALLLVLTGASGLVLAACYGVAFVSKRMSVRVLTNAGSPIKGISLEGPIKEEDVRTDELGKADFTVFLPSFQADESLELTFRDTDGPQNGGEFAEKTLEVPVEGADIVLEPLN